MHLWGPIIFKEKKNFCYYYTCQCTCQCSTIPKLRSKKVINVRGMYWSRWCQIKANVTVWDKSFLFYFDSCDIYNPNVLAKVKKHFLKLILHVFFIRIFAFGGSKMKNVLRTRQCFVESLKYPILFPKPRKL